MSASVRAGKRLPRAFYRRDPREVAPELLNKVLVANDGRRARIVETEAYCGPIDAAAHTYRGQTARNAVMFGAPGLLYVYFTYGMHYCCNVVCGPEGSASAVLLRAGEIVDGLDVARSRRTTAKGDRDLARGPANLCRALAIGAQENGHDLTRDPLTLTPPAAGGGDVRSGPRVGLRLAADRPWRFWSAGEPSVSTYRPAVPRRRGP
jgi:DNA-3-methyladenine glycosylase